MKTDQPTSVQVVRINKAFDKVAAAMRKFARVAEKNGSAIRRVSFQIFSNGSDRIRVTYRRTYE